MSSCVVPGSVALGDCLFCAIAEAATTMTQAMKRRRLVLIARILDMERPRIRRSAWSCTGPKETSQRGWLRVSLEFGPRVATFGIT